MTLMNQSAVNMEMSTINLFLEFLNIKLVRQITLMKVQMMEAWRGHISNYFSSQRAEHLLIQVERL